MKWKEIKPIEIQLGRLPTEARRHPTTLRFRKTRQNRQFRAFVRKNERQKHIRLCKNRPLHKQSVVDHNLDSNIGTIDDFFFSKTKKNNVL